MMNVPLRRPSLACLLAFVALASAGFAQKLAWTYEPVPKSDETFVEVRDLPNVAANGSLLFVTVHYMKSGTSRNGLLWLSAKGAKITEFRFDFVDNGSISRILNVTPNTVSCNFDGDTVRTFKLVKGNLMVANTSVYEADEMLLNYPGAATQPLRHDPFGYVTVENLPNKGTRIRRYLF